MLGPFSLRYIHLFVAKLSSGAFILSKNGKSADYVGMSDRDVAKVLFSFKGTSGYRFFWFSYAENSQQATELASTWYHRYLPSDNTLPPNNLSGPDWQCRIAGCTACALANMRSSLSS